MATYEVKFKIEGKSPASVAKLVRDKLKLPKDSVSVENLRGPGSRAERLALAADSFEDAKAGVEELKEEMEQWHEGIPDNLKDGEKANQVQAAVEALDEVISQMEQVDFSGVEFPGMM